MRKVNIVFDSSVLYPNSDAIVSSDFENFFQEFSKKCDLNIYIPDVVKGELCYQKFSSASDKLERAKELLSNIARTLDRQRKIPYKTEELRTLVEKRFDVWAKKKKVILLETPLDKISLKELQEKSIWRIPPFEDVKRGFEQCKGCRAEKGFRDALILFSVLELVKKNIRNNFYFICGDKLFLITIKKHIKSKRLILLEAIEELSSRLRLSLEKDNERWINRISNRARDVFINRAWKELNIREEIIKRHSERFEIPSTTSEIEFLTSIGSNVQMPDFLSSNQYKSIYDPKHVQIYDPSWIKPQNIYGLSYAPSETKYIPLDEGKFYLDKPSFQKVEDNNIYIWKSRVSHHREYRDPRITASLFPKIYKVHFNVVWSAKVTRNERFYNIKLLDVEFVDEEFT